MTHFGLKTSEIHQKALGHNYFCTYNNCNIIVKIFICVFWKLHSKSIWLKKWKKKHICIEFTYIDVVGKGVNKLESWDSLVAANHPYILVCLQSDTPMPLDSHWAKLFSFPVQWTLSNQIRPKNTGSQCICSRSHQFSLQTFTVLVILS